MAAVNRDILTVTFNGISKAWRAAGFRAGWLTFSGSKKNAAGYIEGMEMLANMRMCANVPAQFGIQTALGGYQSINEFLLPGGRLKEQRDATVNLVGKIPGLSVAVPKGALYCFPKIDMEKFNISDDRKFVMDLLRAEHILVVQGTGFNWNKPDHFRIVFLPTVETLTDALNRLGNFLTTYRQK
jgi:alanine-synthesizing transaminase